MRIDATGNIFGLFTWDHDEPYILCGSHLDSQENGGVYDGAYGELTKPEDLANGMRGSSESPEPLSPTAVFRPRAHRGCGNLRSIEQFACCIFIV